MAEGGEENDSGGGFIVKAFFKKEFSRKAGHCEEGPKNSAASSQGKDLCGTFNQPTMKGTPGLQHWRKIANCTAGKSVICSGLTWCLAPCWVCKPELPNQGSSETPKYGMSHASNSAIENLRKHPSGSTARQTSAK